jgi:hypothetical protein
MSKIYLNDIVSFCDNTYESNLTKHNIKESNFIDKINIVIQNENLNNLKFKCNFIDVLSLTNFYDSNELILVSPLMPEDKKNKMNCWYNLLNSILIVLNDSYINEENDKKQILIHNANELFKTKINKKIDREDFLNKENNYKETLTKASKILNICLCILESTTLNIYNLNDKVDEQNNMKFVVVYKYDDFYFPFIDWNKKYYEHDSHFVNELIKKFKYKENNTKENNTKENITKSNTSNISEKTNKLVKKNKKVKIEEEIENNIENNIENKGKNKIKTDTKNKLTEHIIKSDNDSKINDLSGDKYKEFVSNDKSVLFMSEAVTQINNKKSKKIDMTNNDTDNNNTTAKISEAGKNKIISKATKSMKLDLLQQSALKIGLEIVHKDKKTGKLKNKTKEILYEEIKNASTN